MSEKAKRKRSDNPQTNVWQIRLRWIIFLYCVFLTPLLLYPMRLVGALIAILIGLLFLYIGNAIIRAIAYHEEWTKQTRFTSGLMTLATLISSLIACSLFSGSAWVGVDSLLSELSEMPTVGILWQIASFLLALLNIVVPFLSFNLAFYLHIQRIDAATPSFAKDKQKNDLQYLSSESVADDEDVELHDLVQDEYEAQSNNTNHG